MKIDENLVNKGKKWVYTKSYRHTFYPSGISDDDLFFALILIRTGIRGGSKIIFTDPAVINRKKTLSLA